MNSVFWRKKAAIKCYRGSWWQTAPCWRSLLFKYGALGCWGHFTHTARVVCSQRQKKCIRRFQQHRPIVCISVRADRTLVLWRLQAARAIVPHTAARLALSRFGLLDQFVDLFILTHAGGKFGSQVDQRLLQDRESDVTNTSVRQSAGFSSNKLDTRK